MCLLQNTQCKYIVNAMNRYLKEVLYLKETVKIDSLVKKNDYQSSFRDHFAITVGHTPTMCFSFINLFSTLARKQI